jgi:hypothetical protein
MTRRPILIGPRRIRTVRDQPHGQVLVLFALLLVALLAVSALAVDYGSWLLARRNFQNVADAAALVGASQLTSDPTLVCPTDAGMGSTVGESCAKQAAWQYLKDTLGLAASMSPAAQMAIDPSIPYIDPKGYTIWVASPPSEADTAYPANGHFPDNPMSIFVKVDQPQPSALGHIVHPNDVDVSAWATAGRVAQSYAIVSLCKPDGGHGKTCLAGDADIKIDGGSQVIVPTGDVGANTWTVTNGNSDYIALGSDSGAYEGLFTDCWGSTNCHLVGYPDTSSNRQAIPLGLTITDPAYVLPGGGSGLTSTLTPGQCGYSGTIAAGPETGPLTASNGGPKILESNDLVLAAAIGPQPTVGVTLATTVGGSKQITDASTLAGLNGIKVTLSPGGLNATSAKVAGQDGSYTISGVAAGTYTVTASDTAVPPGYFTQTKTVTVPASGTLAVTFAMVQMPGTATGTVKTSGGATIPGATVTASPGGGSPNPASATPSFTIASLTPGVSYTFTASAPGYVSSTWTTTFNPGQTKSNPFVLGTSGGISGTVTDSGTGLPLSGATVTAGAYSTATLSNGTYSLTGMSPATYTVTFAMVGYTTGTTNNVVVTGGSSTTVNKALVSNSGTLTGTVTDVLYGTKLSGVSVTINGVTGTTNASGVYTIPGVPTAGSPFTVTAKAVGYYDFSSPSKQSITGGNTTTYNFSMGPSTCKKQGNNFTGNWTMCQGVGSLDTCPTPISPSGGSVASAGDVTCSAFTRSNRITPGTYGDIVVPAGECAWIDPIPDTSSGTQVPGVVYITGTLEIDGGAMLFGDGVTIVMGTGSALTIKNSGAFVINYASVYDTATGTCSLGTASTTFGSPRCFRTHPGAASFTSTSTGYYDGNDYSYGAWTTTGIGMWSKNTFGWSVCGSHATVTWDQTYPSCVTRSAIGMAFYVRSGSGYTNIFQHSGAWGFLFMGVLYGPQDNMNLGGQGSQASAGQIVAWTLEYHGGTQIQQRYSGIKVDGPPYLMEPTLGQ